MIKSHWPTSGREPHENFLSSLESTQHNVEKLTNIATATRRYIGGSDIRKNRAQLSEELLYESQHSEDSLANKDLIPDGEMLYKTRKRSIGN